MTSDRAVGVVVEPQLLPVADRGRDLGDERGIDDRVLHVGVGVLRPCGYRLADGVDPAAQLVGQHVLELGQRLGADLLDARHRRPRPEADDHGDRLVLIEEQGRQLAPGPQAVVPSRPAHRLHRIAEGAQPVDVLADGTVGDAEPPGQLGPGPVGPGLEQPEQCEQSCGGLQHGGKSPELLGTKRS
jgi:hypothetical protein